MMKMTRICVVNDKSLDADDGKSQDVDDDKNLCW